MRQEHGRADLADFAERYPTRIAELYGLLKPALSDSAAPNDVDSVTARRLNQLQSAANGQPADLIAERRLRLLRGDSAELPPHYTAPLSSPDSLLHTDLSAPPLSESVEMFMPPKPPSREMRKGNVRPGESVWLEPDGGAPTAGRPLPSAKNQHEAPPAPPAVLGRYQVQKRLGSSGSGSMFEPIDTQLDRRVALRLPRFPADDAQGAYVRFQREARVAASVWHQLLCPILDVGEIDGLPYLAMPFIEAESLAELLLQRPIWPARAAVELVLKLATALDAAHRQGAVHCDFKPSNILLPAPETPVIVGFGQSCPAGSGCIDNAIYIAPEQDAGSNDQVGPRSDVYSLGVIFYQLLTGHLPSHDPIRTTPAVKFPVDIDPALESICLKAMAAAHAYRLATMRELVAELSAYRLTLKRHSDTDTPLPAKVSAPSHLNGSQLPQPLPKKALPAAASLVVPAQPASPAIPLVQQIHQPPDSHLLRRSPSGSVRRKQSGLVPRVVAAALAGVALATVLFVLNRIVSGLTRARVQAAAEKTEAPRVPLEKLRADLKDPSAAVRRAAAEKIKDQKELEAVEDLISLVADDDWPPDGDGQDKTKALAALKELSRENVPRALQNAASAKNMRVQIWACREIAQFGDRKMVSALVRALQDDNPRVQKAAAEILRELRWSSEEAINELSALVSRATVKAKAPKSGEDESDLRAQCRAAALDALIQLDRNRAEETLIQVRNTKNHPAQQWAARQLSSRFPK